MSNHALSCRSLAFISECSVNALKGRDSKAQGNALGKKVAIETRALKGRNQ